MYTCIVLLALATVQDSHSRSGGLMGPDLYLTKALSQLLKALPKQRTLHALDQV